MKDRSRAHADETPLFQDMDKQEATYAPQQRSPENTASGVDVAPATAGAFQPAEVAPGSTTATGAGVGSVAPVVGAAALADETENDDKRDQRES